MNRQGWQRAPFIFLMIHAFNVVNRQGWQRIILFLVIVFSSCTAHAMPPDELALRIVPFSTIVETIQESEDEAQLVCLALAIYHEARGEPYAGRQAVGFVVLNRVAESGQTPCATIWADGGRQFQWTRRPMAALTPTDQPAWEDAQAIALSLMENDAGPDPTHGATFFHNPRIGHRLPGIKVTAIGRHVFLWPVSSHTPLRLLSGHARGHLPAS